MAAVQLRATFSIVVAHARTPVQLAVQMGRRMAMKCKVPVGEACVDPSVPLLCAGTVDALVTERLGGAGLT